MSEVNILNPISEIIVSLGPPSYEADAAITGTLKRPPHKKQTAISFYAQLTAGAAQINIEGYLTEPSAYYWPFVGPGFWPPGDTTPQFIESTQIPDPPWETTDIAISLTIKSVNLVTATLRLYEFKVLIPAHIDWLPIMGIG